MYAPRRARVNPGVRSRDNDVAHRLAPTQCCGQHSRSVSIATGAAMNPQELAQQTDMLWKMVLEYAPPVLGALLVLFAGWTIANWLRRFVTGALEKTKIDATLKPVIASVVRYIVLGLTLMVVMQQFGVQTASLLALLGTIGLAIGLALQGTLSNVAAGLMLLFLRPFEVGNHVEAGGAEGIVLGIDLFHTNLRTTDGVDIVIPNASILSGTIKNMSAFPERIISTTFTLPADSEPGKALDLIRASLASQPLLAHERENNVSIKSISGGGAEILISAWVKNEHYRDARTQLLLEIKEQFKKAKIALG
jgi:small conductance mechanosensitive channel